MFTGLIEETGTFAAVGPRDEHFDFVICSRMVHDVDAPRRFHSWGRHLPHRGGSIDYLYCAIRRNSQPTPYVDHLETRAESRIVEAAIQAVGQTAHRELQISARDAGNNGV